MKERRGVRLWRHPLHQKDSGHLLVSAIFFGPASRCWTPRLRYAQSPKFARKLDKQTFTLSSSANVGSESPCLKKQIHSICFFDLADHTMLESQVVRKRATYRVLLRKTSPHSHKCECYVCGGVRIKNASDNHCRKRGFRIPVSSLPRSVFVTLLCRQTDFFMKNLAWFFRI